MADGESTSKATDINWEQYAKDARSLFLATSAALPTAMRVWTTGWCDWVKSAAETHDQLARRWNSIIQDPGHGGAVLDEMRNDIKQYIVYVAGIPERSVLEFLTSVSESAGSSATPSVPATQGKASPSAAFKQAIDNFVKAAEDTVVQFQSASESQATPSPGKPAGSYPDHLAPLRKQLKALAAARDKLSQRS